MESYKIGDFVLLKNQSSPVEIIAIQGNRIEVAAGLLKMTIKPNQIEKLVAAPEPEIVFPTASIDLNTKEKLMNFKHELDIRGKMKDEIILMLEAAFDDAILLGIKEMRIIHGKGTGALKDTVRNICRKYNEITSVENGPGPGGEGVSVIHFDA